MVKFMDIPKQNQIIKSEFMKRFNDIFDKASFVGGDDLNQFEQHFKDYNGTRHCIGVGSGTDALILALLALNIAPGDEVIVPANTFIATAFAVSHVGAKVVFVDADIETYNMDLSLVEDVITDKTEAVIPVHLYGSPVNVLDLISVIGPNIFVVEDCAQSIGATVKCNKTGSVGDIGCFSFYPAKNLGSLAQAGAIVTDNDIWAKKIRELGNVGRREGSHFDYSYVGYNSRMDTISAAFLDISLQYVDEWNQCRMDNALLYNTMLEKNKDIITPMVKHKQVFHLYELRVENKEIRDGLREHLNACGVATGLHYPVPCHKQAPYDVGESFPVAELLADTLISLPMHPFLTEEELEYVCSCVHKYFDGV